MCIFYIICRSIYIIFRELNIELTFLPFRNQIEILTTRQGKSINSIYNYARL